VEVYVSRCVSRFEREKSRERYKRETKFPAARGLNLSTNCPVHHSQYRLWYIQEGHLFLITMTLDITIKDLPSRHLTGMVVRTNMEKAWTDCPALWQTFGPFLASFPNSATISEAYGLSIMMGDDGTFDYWAVAETPESDPVPEGMKTVKLPAGLYASVFAPNLEQLEAVYREMYSEWQQQQSEYSVDMQGPCVEIYRTGWTPNDPLELWVPVVKKV
jgi:predicted transcriptional regulator YdeE